MPAKCPNISSKPKSARARDFYDIYVLMQEAQIDLSKGDVLELTRQVFAAKEVPLELIGKISNHREFHRPEWPSVEDCITDILQSFDFYFDFVLHATKSLESLWEV